MNPVSKKNFAVFPALDWIATLTAHTPNKGEQRAHYYGAYSNASRGKKKKEKVEEEPTEVIEVPPPLVSKELKKHWSYFIRKVYETDPLVLPSEHRLCPLRRSTTATAFLSEELLSAQDAIH
ncbi:MAG: hypothetical protein O7D29_01100 [Gemmatimonadetes bacterium]|nr:hypothetical protein [Gemmatimonadota bacterium]